EEIIAADGRAVASHHDVSQADQADALVALSASEFGSIDGLINNAALVVSGDQFETTSEEVERIVDVNVKGVMHCGRAAMREMKKQRSGVILNVTSRTHLGWTGTS